MRAKQGFWFTLALIVTPVMIFLLGMHYFASSIHRIIKFSNRS